MNLFRRLSWRLEGVGFSFILARFAPVVFYSGLTR